MSYQYDLELIGLHCVNCVNSLRQQLASLALEIIELSQDRLIAVSNLSSQEIIAKIHSYGYKAICKSTQSEVVPQLLVATSLNAIDADQQAALLRPLGLSIDTKADEPEKKSLLAIEKEKNCRHALIAGIPGLALFLMCSFGLLPSVTVFTGQLFWLAVGLFTVLNLTITANDIYCSAYRDIRLKSFSMYTLIALSTGIAWLFSMLVCVFPLLIPMLMQQLYFESALLIVAIVKLGHYIQSDTRLRAAEEASRFKSVFPSSAFVVKNREVTQVKVSTIHENNIVLVQKNTIFPTDGHIIDGNTTVNESMLTGEAQSIPKQHYDPVSAGTQNVGEPVLVQTTAAGLNTKYSKILAAARGIQETQTPSTPIVDRITAIFVPSVIVTALVATVIWFCLGPTPQLGYALAVSLATLVVACPCALGLATPLALAVGGRKAVDLNILVLNSDALQKLSSVDTVVFDKTGTLTEGRLTVKQVNCFDDDYPEAAVVAYVEALEKVVEATDSYARAILQYSGAVAKTVEVDHATLDPGQGIIGEIKSKTVIVGSQSLLLSQGIILKQYSTERQTANQSLELELYVAIAGQHVATIHLVDEIKPGAKAVIAKLKEQGKKVEMLTGDVEENAKQVASLVGIDAVDVYFKKDPEAKQQRIKGLQDHKHIVAMVGDGINDTAALAQANVGIAMNTTAEPVQSAGLVLLNNKLETLLGGLEISRLTTQNIWQNLYFAFFYNIIAIAFATGALYPFTGVLLHPAVAAFAMLASSLTVVYNARRLYHMSMEYQKTGQEAHVEEEVTLLNPTDYQSCGPRKATFSNTKDPASGVSSDHSNSLSCSS